MIECALFGAGRIGKIHAGNVAREAGARLKYVIDPNAEAASALATEHGATTATTEAGVCRQGDRCGADLLLYRHARRPDPRRGRGRQADLLRKADRPRHRARANLRGSRRARRRHLHDRLPAPLRSHVLRGEDEARRRRDRHPGDADRDEPRSRRAADSLHQELGRDLQGHADPRLRRVSLDSRGRGGDRPRECVVPRRFRDLRCGRRRFHRSDDPHEDGATLPDQHEPPRGVRLRPALRGAGERRHAAGRQSRADRSRSRTRRPR